MRASGKEVGGISAQLSSLFETPEIYIIASIVNFPPAEESEQKQVLASCEEAGGGEGVDAAMKKLYISIDETQP